MIECFDTMSFSSLIVHLHSNVGHVVGHAQARDTKIYCIAFLSSEVEERINVHVCMHLVTNNKV